MKIGSNIVVFNMKTLYGLVSSRSLARKKVYGLKFRAVRLSFDIVDFVLVH